MPSDALPQSLRVGDKEIVADELAAIADRLGQRLPAFPVVLFDMPSSIEAIGSYVQDLVPHKLVAKAQPGFI